MNDKDFNKWASIQFKNIFFEGMLAGGITALALYSIIYMIIALYTKTF